MCDKFHLDDLGEVWDTTIHQQSKRLQTTVTI